jgi:hypothetical protein
MSGSIGIDSVGHAGALSDTGLVNLGVKGPPAVPGRMVSWEVQPGDSRTYDNDVGPVAGGGQDVAHIYARGVDRWVSATYDLPEDVLYMPMDAQLVGINSDNSRRYKMFSVELPAGEVYHWYRWCSAESSTTRQVASRWGDAKSALHQAIACINEAHSVAEQRWDSSDQAPAFKQMAVQQAQFLTQLMATCAQLQQGLSWIADEQAASESLESAAPGRIGGKLGVGRVAAEGLDSHSFEVVAQDASGEAHDVGDELSDHISETRRHATNMFLPPDQQDPGDNKNKGIIDGGAQTAVEAASFFPVIGTPADIASIADSWAEGDALGVGLGVVGLVPVFGDLGKGAGKGIRKLIRFIFGKSDDVIAAERAASAARHADEVVAGLVARMDHSFTTLRPPNSPWHLRPFPRGRAVEDVLNANLRDWPNFPRIDDFQAATGTATSIKSVDLTAKTYQRAGGLEYRLRKYVNDVQGFNGARRTNRAGDVADIPAASVQHRELVVAVERGTITHDQQQVINTITRNAANGHPPVKVVVKEVR